MSKSGCALAASIKVTVFNDPGHGWLRIRKVDVERLGIGSAITIYSFQRGQYAYLEEDQDAGTALNKAKELGIPVVFGKSRHCNRHSTIRSYDRWTA